MYVVYKRPPYIISYNKLQCFAFNLYNTIWGQIRKIVDDSNLHIGGSITFDVEYLVTNVSIYLDNKNQSTSSPVSLLLKCNDVITYLPLLKLYPLKHTIVNEG